MQIRRAILSDTKGIAKVHVDSWKTTYAGIVPGKYLQSLNYKSKEQKWRNLFQREVFL